MMDVWSLFEFRWILFSIIISIVIYQLVFKRSSSSVNKDKLKFIRGLPIVGAQWRIFTGQESFTAGVLRSYRQFPEEKIFALSDLGGKVTYVIRDPDLIKKIAIKDFDHFMNHQIFIDTEVDKLFGRTLFVMRDQRWKNMRTNLSPAFTGSKMRLMFSLIGDVSNSFCDHLKNQIKLNGPIECNIVDNFKCFANDAIASCAFGINIDSMKDKNNEFFQRADSLSDFAKFSVFLKFLLLGMAPKLAKLFKIRFFKPDDCSFLRETVKNNMEYREKNGIVRNDMINLLMQLKKGTLTQDADNENDGDIGFATVQESFEKIKTNPKQDWTDDDLVAQCLIFILGGFNTVALTLSFIAHDLATHPDIQAKLYEEISNITEKLNGKPITYETIQKMKYLDMVLSESMRMWPQVAISDRIVNKKYELQIDEYTNIVLSPGEIVQFPVVGLHLDEKYFPNPDKYDPERFSDENKVNIVSGSYMPFGIGPRNCIASRFALMELKACIFHLLSNCKLEMCEKTQHPLKLKPSSGTVEAEKGFWMKIKLRE